MFKKRLPCANQSETTIKILFPAHGRSSLKASLTVEAALALPIFMLLCAALISFAAIYCLQTDLQAGMDETSRILGKAAYLTEHDADGASSENIFTGQLIEPAYISDGISSAGISSMLYRNRTSVTAWSFISLEISP